MAVVSIALLMRWKSDRKNFILTINLLIIFLQPTLDEGDLVDDTPAQTRNGGGIDSFCPARYPDSCPNEPGRDPLDNIMDYSADECPDLFTDGQAERMKDAWDIYRN